MTACSQVTGIIKYVQKRKQKLTFKKMRGRKSYSTNRLHIGKLSSKHCSEFQIGQRTGLSKKSDGDFSGLMQSGMN